MSDQQTILVVLIVLAAFWAGARSSKWAARVSRRPWRARAPAEASGNGSRAAAATSGTDATEQLRIVMSADFRRRRLMSPDEAKVFNAAEQVVKQVGLKWRVMAQVSLGEILASPDPRAYAAVNSKRVDILLIASTGEPVVAIEYQGSGHYLGTAAARDAVKKEALRRAGVAYVEVTPDHDFADHLTRELSRIAGAKRPSLAA